MPPAQAPAVQLWPETHAFPVEQLVPSAATGLEQLPVDGSHTPATWHASSATHVFVVPPPQVPALHVCPLMHELPVEQAAPLLTGVTVQLEVPLHARVAQVSEVQVMGLPAQLPATH